jgi:hypothetical protein
MPWQRRLIQIHLELQRIGGDLHHNALTAQTTDLPHANPITQLHLQQAAEMLGTMIL